MPVESDLVDQGLAIVRAVSRRLARRLGGHVQLDDLTGIGNLALLEVTKQWDPARASFVSYATVRVRWAILDVLRRDSHARSTAARASALLASERLAEEHAESPEPLAPTTLEEDQAGLASLLQDHAAALVCGLLAPPPEARALETPEEAVEQAELAHVVKGVIGTLPDDRQRQLMERHYYGGEAFDAIAQDLGISKSWASRLHERAVVAVAVRVGGRVPGAAGGAPRSPVSLEPW
jgi:RNA polymerase sigma factor for flagellar operon FliA